MRVLVLLINTFEPICGLFKTFSISDIIDYKGSSQIGIRREANVVDYASTGGICNLEFDSHFVAIFVGWVVVVH